MLDCSTHIKYCNAFINIFRPLTRDEVLAGDIAWEVAYTKKNLVKKAFVTDKPCPTDPAPIQVRYSLILLIKKFLKGSFVKIKFSQNGEITLPFTDVVNLAPVAVFNTANMSFHAFCEN